MLVRFNRFVGQNSDETMLNASVIAAMTEIDDDETLYLNQRQSERLKENMAIATRRPKRLL